MCPTEITAFSDMHEKFAAVNCEVESMRRLWWLPCACTDAMITLSGR